jgi:disulfide bond formation protein DsbB
MSDALGHLAAARAYYGQQVAAYIGTGAEYGLSVLRSAIILSGGSLIAFPTVVVAFRLAIGPSEIVLPAAIFVLSVVTAALSMFLAYMNFNSMADGAWCDLNREEIEIAEKHDTETFHRLRNHRQKTKQEWLNIASKAEKRTEWTFWAATIFGVLAYLLFAVGVVLSGVELVSSARLDDSQSPAVVVLSESAKDPLTKP